MLFVAATLLATTTAFTPAARTTLAPALLTRFHSRAHAVMMPDAATLLSSTGVDSAATLLSSTIDATFFIGDSILMRMPTAGWSVAMALAVLGIGQAFESSTHAIKHAVPRSLMPVFDAILFELTSLGFTGLVISSVGAASEDSWLARVSEHYLGHASELFELFEGCDRALFPTVVAFIGACAVLVGVVNSQFEANKQATQAELLRAKLAADDERDACRDGTEAGAACRVARRRSNRHNGLLLESFRIPAIDGSRSAPLAGGLRALVAPPAERRAEFLRFRGRFIEQSAAVGEPLPIDFHFGKYLQCVAADNLRELVSVEPVQLVLVWLPLIVCEIVGLSLTGGVDQDFLPSLFALAQAPIGLWAAWTYVRLHHIKSLIMPQLGVLGGGAAEAGAEGGVGGDTSIGGRIFRLLPPPSALLGGTVRRRRTPLDALAAVVERPFGAPSAFAHEELFGALGPRGPAFYRSSLQLVLFSSIVSLAYFGGGGGGLDAACHHCQLDGAAAVPLPAAVSALLTCLPSAAAVLLTPFSFLNLNLATSVEGYRKQAVVDAVLIGASHRARTDPSALSRAFRAQRTTDAAGTCACVRHRCSPSSAPSASA